MRGSCQRNVVPRDQQQEARRALPSPQLLLLLAGGEKASSPFTAGTWQLLLVAHRGHCLCLQRQPRRPNEATNLGSS
jgi:hypothetical protein